MSQSLKSDVIIVGAGLAGLVAAVEAANRGRKVLILDQEGPQNLGGQAFWSLGGLFMVDTPEQRSMGIKDSLELATQDWLGSAQFDRPTDANPRATAEAFLDFAAGDMRTWLHGMGMRWFPVVGWAERGGAMADGHGNSVPRFHLTWGTGPGVLKPFLDTAQDLIKTGKIRIKYRHCVTEMDLKARSVMGQVLMETTTDRGEASNRDVTDDFIGTGESIILSSGGMGGDHGLVRKYWPVDRLGPPPDRMISGVPDHVDGAAIEAAQTAGAGLTHMDRMWHYCEGIHNWDPIWPKHGIRILPGPSSIWLDALGDRMEAPCFPGFDTLSTLKRILKTGHGHSWFILTQKIIEKEFALSGSEQNPDFTSGKWVEVLKSRMGKGAPAPVEAFKEKGADFIVRDTLEDLVAAMNELTPDTPLGLDHVRGQIEARDREVDNKFAKDAQVIALNATRAYRGDRLIRTAKPHRILESKNGPLIAVRLNILTRKSLGGLHTDVKARLLDTKGKPIDGWFAAGEAAGFGGGGYHGYNALEGTFLGGCLFSGRTAGRGC